MRILRTLVCLVIAALLVYVSGFVGPGVQQRDVSGAWIPQTRAPIQLPLHNTSIVGLAVRSGNLADAAVKTCKIDVSSPALGTAVADVTDVQSGTLLTDDGATRAVTTASTTKIATASAALRVLGPNARFTTAVVAGATPGQIVLVGGGDATLTQTANPWYTMASQLPALVAQVQAWSQSTGTPVTSVVYDNNRFTGPNWNPGWDAGYVADGTQAPVSALMLDGGREQGSDEYSPRVADPALAAATVFANDLGITDPAAITAGRAADGATRIGAIESSTVREQVSFMLEYSDNVLADALARQVAIATGRSGSFSSINAAYREVLGWLGVDSGLPADFTDGSGLSPNTKIAPAILTALLANAEVEPDVLPLIPELTSPGLPGTLKERLSNLAPDVQAQLHAKTGSLAKIATLAGVVPSSNGHMLAFFIGAENVESTAAARAAIDLVVGQIHACS